MAYMSQENKKEIAQILKPILKKYGVKGSLRVRHHSTLVLTIKSGKLDFIENWNKVNAGRYDVCGREMPPMTEQRMNVNVYWTQDRFEGKVKKFFAEVIKAMKGPQYFDHSDPMTDYFHTSHYYDISIGSYEKPYELVK